MDCIKRKTIGKYFLKLSCLFLCVTIVTAVLGMNISKQTINNAYTATITDLFEILINNTCVFLVLLFTISISKKYIYYLLIVNAIHTGLLISVFSKFSYILTLIPHGWLECMSFFLMGACICAYLDSESGINKKHVIKIGIISYIMLVIAACLEVWATPYLVSKYLF